MSTRLLTTVSILLALRASSPAAAAPISPEKLPLIDKLPAETTHYAFRAGSDVLAKKLEGTPVGDLVKDEEMAEFLRSLEGLFDKSTDEFRKSIWQLVKHAFYCDLVCAHVRGRKGEAELLMAALPQSADRRKSLRDAYDRHVQTVFGSGKDKSEIVERVPGGELYGRRDSANAQVGWVADRLVLAFGPSARAAILGESPKQSLAESAAFERATRQLKLENPIGFYYYHLKPLWDDWTENEAADPNSGPGRVVASGLTSLVAMAGASNVAGGRYRNEHYWVVDERQGGLFRHVANNAIPPNWLRLLPEDAVSFTYGTWEPESFLRLFMSDTGSEGLFGPAVERRKFKEIEPGEAEVKEKEADDEAPEDDEPIVVENFQTQDAGWEKFEPEEDGGKPQAGPETSSEEERSKADRKGDAPDPNSIGRLGGVEIDRKLVRAMGMRYMIYRVPTEGGVMNPMFMMLPPLVVLPPHQMVFALELVDEPGFRESFQKYWLQATKYIEKLRADGEGMGFAAPNIRTFKYRGETVYEFSMILAAYLHIGKDRLLISMNPQLIKDAIRQSQKPGASLVDKPEFKAVYAKVPKDACFLVYMHKKAFVEQLYKGYMSLAQQLGPMLLGAVSDGDAIDFSFADLPSASSIMQYMKSSGYLYGVAKDGGVLFEGEADYLPLAWWVANIQGAVDLIKAEFPEAE